jgi:hypothetical protein
MEKTQGQGSVRIEAHVPKATEFPFNGLVRVFACTRQDAIVCGKVNKMG